MIETASAQNGSSGSNRAGSIREGTKQPLVSMVVPCFNHAAYVQECVRSIIRQDYRNIELLVIDDGSADRSVDKITELVSECSARFVRFEFRHRPNKGLAATLNEGMDWAKGEFFAALASDDVLVPEKTSTLVGHLLADDKLAGVFSGCTTIDPAGRTLRTISPAQACYGFDEVITNKCSILAPTQLLRLNNVKEVGGYPDGLFVEDWYMWLALTARGCMLKSIPDVLVLYRIHGGNTSRQAKRMHESCVSVLGKYKDHKLYPESLARLHLTASVNTRPDSRRDSIQHLLTAYAIAPRVAFSRPFWDAALQFVLPAAITRGLSTVIAKLRTRSGAVRRT